MRELIEKLEGAGYGYYISGMVIWYGKGKKRDKRMEVNYIERIGGDVDYKRGFEKINEREGILTNPQGNR